MMKENLGEGDQGETKWGKDRKGYKRGQSCKTGLVCMLVWLSSAPDHRSLPCLLIKSFLNSLCNLTLFHVYVCCKD